MRKFEYFVDIQYEDDLFETACGLFYENIPDEFFNPQNMDETQHILLTEVEFFNLKQAINSPTLPPVSNAE